MPESFGLKLDEDEVEFIGRLLSFDKFKIQVYLKRARPVQDKIYQVLRKCEKRVHYGKIPSTTGTTAPQPAIPEDDEDEEVDEEGKKKMFLFNFFDFLNFFKIYFKIYRC